MSQGNLIRGLNLGPGGTGGYYFIEVAGRKIEGSLDDRVVGRSMVVGNQVFETLWDQGGTYTYLTADTQLFASSDSASDTGVIMLVQGLNDNYQTISAIVSLNGQTQVAISELMFRVHVIIIATDTTPVGNVYLAEADTLTLGKPDDVNKIKAKIELNEFDSGDFASWNISHNGFFTVPANKNLHVLALFPTIPKNDDIQFDFRARVDGGAWLSLNTLWGYQNPSGLPLLQTPRISDRSDIEIRVRSGNINGNCEANLQFILVDTT